jgi:hypothetical protein
MSIMLLEYEQIRETAKIRNRLAAAQPRMHYVSNQDINMNNQDIHSRKYNIRSKIEFYIDPSFISFT